MYYSIKAKSFHFFFYQPKVKEAKNRKGGAAKPFKSPLKDEGGNVVFKLASENGVLATL